MLTGLLLTLCATSLSGPDPFQLVHVVGTDTFFVAYAPVHVQRGNTTLVERRTDRYGRLTLDLPAGTYAADVTYRGRTWRITFTTRGSRALTRIEVD